MEGFRVFQHGEFSEYDIERLLSISEISQASFRYFKNRGIRVIDNHLCTILYFYNGVPVCYGHLDIEDDNVWLGICVADDFKGRGLGNDMLSRLIFEARNKRLKTIRLAVDIDNVNAIKLYTKFGFEPYESYLDKYQKMQKNIDIL